MRKRGSAPCIRKLSSKTDMKLHTKVIITVSRVVTNVAVTVLYTVQCTQYCAPDFRIWYSAAWSRRLGGGWPNEGSGELVQGDFEGIWADREEEFIQKKRQRSSLLSGGQSWFNPLTYSFSSVRLWRNGFIENRHFAKRVHRKNGWSSSSHNRRRMETEAKANNRRCFLGENGHPLRLCSRQKIYKGWPGQYYSNFLKIITVVLLRFFLYCLVAQWKHRGHSLWGKLVQISSASNN